MTEAEDIRRLYREREWERAQRAQERRRRREWVIVVMGTAIVIVGAILWASGGKL